MNRVCRVRARGLVRSARTPARLIFRRVMASAALVLLTAAGSSLAVPAPLLGIWALAPATRGVDDRPSPEVRVVISNGAVRGTYGCGRFDGTISAEANRVRIVVRPLPPAPNERCVYVNDQPIVRQLNLVSHYAVSSQRLVLFLKGQRLQFDRIGFVTPAEK